jgi:transcriptional antiterminator
LANESVTRIAETLRVSRATVYRHIAGITETAVEPGHAKVDPSPKRQRG